MKFAPRLFPHVFHRCPACSTPLPERLSRCVPFLLCRDVPTFSPVFNGLTVFSTVTFGGAQSASCGLLCTSGRAIRCQTLAVTSIVSPGCARPGFQSTRGLRAMVWQRSEFGSCPPAHSIPRTPHPGASRSRSQPCERCSSPPLYMFCGGWLVVDPPIRYR
jgi:hypothetical protein